MLSDIVQHPFQYYELENDPFWEHVNFENSENQYFEEIAHNLNLVFQDKLENGGILDFVKQYTRKSILMLEHSNQREIVRPLLENTLWLLVVYYNFLRLRSRSHFSETDSVYTWKFDPKILANVRQVADEMELENIRHKDYDLKKSPELLDWVHKTLRPLISGYTGMRVVSPSGKLRYSDGTRHSSVWEKRFKYHKFADYHFDKSCYSLPLIIYLDDVSEDCGPFTYVDGSDKMSLNYLLRAYHQALFHYCNIGPVDDSERTMIGALPSVFRGGDRVGSYADTKLFEQHDVVNFTGPMGSAVQFDGFHLVHTGGMPRSGSRKSLLINFRFPRNKVSEMLGFVACKYWRFKIQ